MRALSPSLDTVRVCIIQEERSAKEGSPAAPTVQFLDETSTQRRNGDYVHLENLLGGSDVSAVFLGCCPRGYCGTFTRFVYHRKHPSSCCRDEHCARPEAGRIQYEQSLPQFHSPLVSSLSPPRPLSLPISLPRLLSPGAFAVDVSREFPLKCCISRRFSAQLSSLQMQLLVSELVPKPGLLTGSAWRGATIAGTMLNYDFKWVPPLRSSPPPCFCA